MNTRMKYYMRGLGFGIIITTIILSISHRNSRLTDENAIKRAKELGYVLEEKNESQNDQNKIDIEAIKAQMTPAAVNTEPPAPTQAVVTSSPEATDTPETEATTTPLPTMFPTATPMPTNTPEPLPTNIPTPSVVTNSGREPRGYVEALADYNPEDIKTFGSVICWPSEKPVEKYIRIEGGKNGYEICNLLQIEGILLDANSFSRYAVYTEMAYYFNAGTFFLSSDMTFDTLLSVLTGYTWRGKYSENFD